MNRLRRKHLRGRHNQDDHAGADAAGLDPLGLAKRIVLDDDERFIASESGRIQRGKDEYGIPMALVDTRSGPRLRLGQETNGDATAWDAMPGYSVSAELTPAQIREMHDGLTSMVEAWDREELRAHELGKAYADAKIGERERVTKRPATAEERATTGYSTAYDVTYEPPLSPAEENLNAEYTRYIDDYVATGQLTDGVRWALRGTDADEPGDDEELFASVVFGNEPSPGDPQFDSRRDVRAYQKRLQKMLALAEPATSADEGTKSYRPSGRLSMNRTRPPHRQSLKRTYVRDGDGQFARTPGGGASLGKLGDALTELAGGPDAVGGAYFDDRDNAEEGRYLDFSSRNNDDTSTLEIGTAEDEPVQMDVTDAQLAAIARSIGAHIVMRDMPEPDPSDPNSLLSHATMYGDEHFVPDLGDEDRSFDFYWNKTSGEFDLEISDGTDTIQMTVSEAEARQLQASIVAKLMADRQADLEEARRRFHEGKDRPGSGRRMKRTYVRDGDGQFAETPGGDGGSGKNPADKLNLFSKLAPILGHDITVVSSRKVPVSKNKNHDSYDMAVAVVDTPEGRQVRIGVVKKASKWQGGRDPDDDAAIADLEAEIAQLEVEDAPDEARIDRLSTQLGELIEKRDSGDRTAVLSADGAAQLQRDIEEPLGRAIEFSDAFNAYWESPETEAKFAEAQSLEQKKRKGTITDAESARLDQIRREMEAEEKALGIWDGGADFGEGVVPGADGFDLVWRVGGTDDGEGGWTLDIAVRPPNSDDNWGPGSHDDARARFTEGETASLDDILDELAGSGAKGRNGFSVKTGSGTMHQTKTQPRSRFTIKAADKGEFTAVVATLGQVDSDNDVTKQGAFDGSEFPLSAYGHTSWGGALPVGVARIKEVGNEAILEGRFFLDTAHGRDTFTTVKHLGELGQWSYGYDAVEFEHGYHEGKAVRFLKKLKVHEASPVLVGAGVNTRTLSTKNRNSSFSGEAATVVTAVKALTDRAAEVMAMRRQRGKGLGADSVRLLTQVTGELKRLQDILDAPASDADVLNAIWLSQVERAHR